MCQWLMGTTERRRLMSSMRCQTCWQRSHGWVLEPVTNHCTQYTLPSQREVFPHITFSQQTSSSFNPMYVNWIKRGCGLLRRGNEDKDLLWHLPPRERVLWHVTVVNRRLTLRTISRRSDGWLQTNKSTATVWVSHVEAMADYGLTIQVLCLKET